MKNQYFAFLYKHDPDTHFWGNPNPLGYFITFPSAATRNRWLVGQNTSRAYGFRYVQPVTFDWMREFVFPEPKNQDDEFIRVTVHADGLPDDGTYVEYRQSRWDGPIPPHEEYSVRCAVPLIPTADYQRVADPGVRAGSKPVTPPNPRVELQRAVELTIADAILRRHPAIRLSETGDTALFPNLRHRETGTAYIDPQLRYGLNGQIEQLHDAGIPLVTSPVAGAEQFRRLFFCGNWGGLVARPNKTRAALLAATATPEFNDEIGF